MTCEDCPYEKNELQTVEEFQAWDVLTGCLGQLKFSPAGHVIGLDLHACFALAQARFYDLQSVSELLQDAEPVIVSLLNERSES
ncbi:MAG: hypothetical protein H6861_08280 [Rhodospirillales bacterium]|nr:hypothetical protein [Rhodospirillales bacterium]